MLNCPLCEHDASDYLDDRRRTYFHCACCDLVFADPASHLDPVREKEEYDRHENDPADVRYRGFLNRLAVPLLGRLTPGMEGLDFGCGPGPTLSVMLEEAGMAMTLFDPYYRPNADALGRSYDFVTCTEVVEHFQATRPGLATLDAVAPTWRLVGNHDQARDQSRSVRELALLGRPHPREFLQPQDLFLAGSPFRFSRSNGWIATYWFSKNATPSDCRRPEPPGCP